MLDHFKDKQPVVIVDVICCLYDALIALRVAKASHIHCKHIVPLFCMIHSNVAHMTAIRTVTMHLENNSFSRLIICRSPSVSLQLDWVFAILKDLDVDEVSLWENYVLPSEAFKGL